MQPSADLWQQVPGYDEEAAHVGLPEPTAKQLEGRLNEVLGALAGRHVERPTIQFRPAPLPGSKASASSKSRSSTSTQPAFLLNADAPLLRDTFTFNGMIPTLCNDYAIQWSGPNIRDADYQSMMDWQRINHFPNSTELTRKDRLWLHFAQMAKSYGKGCFDFVPETYVLPDDFDAFLHCYQRSKNCHWIVKPNASSRGRGIFILQDLSELPVDETVVVSRYIENPLLIQGYKFDLRVYVLVTSYDPLKAYIYREGLTRFASAPYSTQEEHMQDAFRHLTNYSVNKNSFAFVENSDMRADNVGHKWSLSALNKHLRCVGVDVDLMWVRVMDLLVKTLLSVEPSISSRTKQVIGHRENCFELYGFDVLVDEDLKPWLLEVNLSPSMQAESPLDWQIKSSLLADTFNLVGVSSNERPAPKLERMRAYSQPWKQIKESRKDDVAIDEGLPPLVLNALSDAPLKMLAKSIGERARCHNFVVLYPTKAGVKRYGMITEARAKGKSRLSQSQMLASILYGPFPSRSVADCKRSGRVDLVYDELYAEGEEWPEDEASPLVADLDTILRTSTSSQWKESRPAFFAKPLPAAVNPAVDPGLRQAALSTAWRALRDLSGRRTPPKEEKEGDDCAELAASGSCILLMEYLMRMEATCECLGAAGRARLAQGASYARLSKFQRHLPKAAAKLASLNGHLEAPEAISENGCLVEDISAVCRQSLGVLERAAWHQEDEDRRDPSRPSSGECSLVKRLPSSLLHENNCRRLLKALPDLQATDLEKLLRAHFLEDLGNPSPQMLECFRPEALEEHVCTDFRRSASIQPGLIKEPTSLSQSRLPVIGELRTLRPRKHAAPGPLSEILGEAQSQATKEPSQRRRPGRQATPMRGLYRTTLTSWSKSSSHVSLPSDVKEAKMASTVMMPVPRFMSMRRSSKTRSQVLPELPEASWVRAEGTPVDQKEVYQASANLKFDIEL